VLNENAKKWIAALRSGKYQQSQFRLTRLDTEGNVIGHCCLGVACELAIQNGVPLEVNTEESELLIEGPLTKVKARSYNQMSSFLPKSVWEWLGLQSCNGMHQADSLSSMNDSGKTFEEIATLIESEPAGLFASS
jgi:hypothetical protein